MTCCLCAFVPNTRQSAVTLGPVNIAVGHQRSGATYSLRMSLDLTSRTIPERIGREPGTRYRAPNIVERDHCRGGGLHVWAGIAKNGRTDLYVFAGGSVTAVVRYQTKSYTLLCGLLSLQWVPTRYLWAITPALIEHDWCGVIWRVKPFHRRRGLLDYRT
ncbi:hypothetical protein AVEN_64084-1 [Araneus ventricosus]|uniref:Uncharacterized protein n=1 Tax=Araneus ventricosus TaxID=182803 RepID=A0A4Y2K1U4_ARAVE|nr:hypothetical protein AVEN_64084-1 [Araneus ventricosus]